MTFEEFLENNIKTIPFDDPTQNNRIINTWHTYLDNISKKKTIIFTEYTKKLLAYYCEYIELYNNRPLCYSETIPQRINMDMIIDIFLIKSLNCKRIPIKQKVYNYGKNVLEYQLENGEYVEISDGKLIGPEININLLNFPLAFIKHISLGDYRNIKIDKINEE